MFKIILVLLIMLTSFPIGYLLAWFCKDELVQGRKWFKMIAVICALPIILFLLVRINNWIEMSSGLAYLAIISLVGLRLSYKKGFVK